MTDTPAEKAEKAAIRRRWISLGEFVAVAGLIISALALWNGYTDRRTDQAEKQAEKAQASRMLACSFIGSAATVRAELAEFLAATEADELIVAAAIYDHEVRLRSYELLASAMLAKE